MYHGRSSCYTLYMYKKGAPSRNVGTLVVTAANRRLIYSLRFVCNHAKRSI